MNRMEDIRDGMFGECARCEVGREWTEWTKVGHGGEKKHFCE